MNRPHIVVLHRWIDRYAEYEQYLDHREYAVTYVTTAFGRAGCPATATDVVEVPATDDLAAVRVAVTGLARTHGAPRTIVALKEDDLPVAAELRRDWDCGGMSPESLRRFTDKLVMAQVVAGAGLAVPAFAAATDPAAVLSFADRHGWPLIIKPRVGSASDGVSKLTGPADVDTADFPPGRPMLVQQFNPGQVYHVDGVFDGRRLGPWTCSRYLNTCLEFRHGTALGSVEEDDERIVAAIGAFSGRVLGALSTEPLVFHLEVFVSQTPGGGVDCTFLEIGARVGGGEIPFLWREVHGYDLMAAAFRIALGERLPEVERAPSGGVAGWLLVPAPAERPCRITRSTSMVGRSGGPYAEAVLEPGQILSAADTFYEHVGGRFRFRGASTTELVQSVLATAAAFRVEGVPVGTRLAEPLAVSGAV